MGTPLASTDPHVVWEPCGACWGQRVIWHRGDGGLRRETCFGCLGVGQRAVAVPRRTAGPARR